MDTSRHTADGAMFEWVVARRAHAHAIMHAAGGTEAVTELAELKVLRKQVVLEWAERGVGEDSEVRTQIINTPMRNV